MKRYVHTCLLFALLVWSSCNPSSLSPADYMAWVRNDDNGLRVEKVIDQYTFSLQYKPFEYEALQELGPAKATRSSVEAKRAMYDSTQYFTLHIKSGNHQEVLNTNGNALEQAQWLEYFMGPAQDDILLVDGKDTLPCILYHFERSYNLDNGNAIVLGFEKTSRSHTGDKEIIYNDQVLETGPVHFTISQAAIQKIPQIRYE